jgi:ABC-type antimicrobial peptide transport system permease subunit
MLLAAMGLYGSLAETVRRRRRELGIRMALGADSGALMRMVTGQGLRLSSAGLALGLAATLALSRVLESFLYGLEPYDPLTLGLVGALLLCVSAVACLAPARRATTVNPVTVLKTE